MPASVSDDKTSGIVYALECINCVGTSVSIVNMEKNKKVLECEEIEFDITFVDFYNYSSKSIICVN